MSGDLSKEADEEREHFKKVVDAFRSYRRDSKDRLFKSQAHIKAIPSAHQQLLLKYGHMQHLEQLAACVDLNMKVIDDIICDAENMFQNEIDSANGGEVAAERRVRQTQPADIEKVHSTLKAIVRDWSPEGAEERKLCYDPILRKIEEIFGSQERESIKVLVPGAGLGRLSWEIANRGFECQGNEFSLFMLLASNFVLNKCKVKNGKEIHPWIHQFTNNICGKDATRAVKFPDVDPGSLPENNAFSMAAGDFLEVYRNDEYKGYFDCVATCFFIDCAHNIVEFIEIIHRILKPGGKWINLGPLLYHFADIPREASIEPPYDVVRSVITNSGFRYDEEDTNVRATYCQNSRSMLQFYYNCIYFTCTKL